MLLDNNSIIQEFILASLLLGDKLADQSNLTEVEAKWLDKLDKVIGILDKEIAKKALEILEFKEEK